ncbi:hypothetical protein SB861_49620 [Paraburkholderia sp. SIMBA_049]
MDIVTETRPIEPRALRLTRSLQRACALVVSAISGAAVDAVAREFFSSADLDVRAAQMFPLNGVLVSLTWVLAWSLLTFEQRKPFGTTVMRYVWMVLYHGAGTVFMLRFAFAIANTLHDVIWQALRTTRFESLTIGVRIVTEVASATGLIVMLVMLPRVLARLQLRGHISARAADDCLWFAAVFWALGAFAAWYVNVSWEPDRFFGPFSDMIAVTGFMLTRVALSRPKPEHAPSLVIVLLESGNSRPLRRFINRFSGRWSLGPVTLLAPASSAIDYYGAHARVAARAGRLKTLFPKTEGDLRRAQKERPRDDAWRTLIVRECYPALPLWSDYFRSLLTPSTWVLLVAESHDLVTAGDASRRLDAIRASLPISRTFALTGEEVPMTLRGLRVVRIAAVGRDTAKRAANVLQRHIGHHEGWHMPETPDWPAFYLGAPLAWNALGVCALFALGALLSQGFGQRPAMMMVVAVIVAINHSIAAAVAVLSKRYLTFARRTFWSGRPKGVYLLSGLATFVILVGVSAVTYALRARVGYAPMTPFFSQTKWLLLSVTLTVMLASLCDNNVLEATDPRWLRPLESLVLACVMALVGWLVIRWVTPDIERVRPDLPVRQWVPVLISAGIGALFGYTWPSWYRRSLRATTQKASPEKRTKPPLESSIE